MIFDSSCVPYNQSVTKDKMKNSLYEENKTNEKTTMTCRIIRNTCICNQCKSQVRVSMWEWQLKLEAKWESQRESQSEYRYQNDCQS